MRPLELKEYVKFCITNNLSLMIKGKPGIGKTDIVFQAAKELNVEVVLWHPVVDDPTDYKGLGFPLGDHAEFLPYGNLYKLSTAKEKLVCFGDDFGQAVPAVQAAWMQLLLAREINGKKISENVVFITATNRKEDFAGVSGILEPVKSRMRAGIVELEVNTDDWVMWALNNNVPTELISYIRFKPEVLDSFKATRDLINSACPRTITFAGNVMQLGLKKDLEYEAFIGIAGEAFATEFIAFLETLRSLPNVDLIILNPDTSEVYDKPDVLYALCGALIDRAKDTNFSNIVRYINRIPPEFGVMCIKDITTKKPELVNTRAYIDWASKHTDIF